MDVRAAAGWLMTELSTDPLMVSLVQVAASLPMFLFALPAGALADIIDKRRLPHRRRGRDRRGLGAVRRARLARACHARYVIGLHVPRRGRRARWSRPPGSRSCRSSCREQELLAAVAINSVGVNISRAVGPALGGVLTVGLGIVAPFWVNAFSNLGSIGALLWWRPPQTASTRLPAERFASAIRTGLRYARNNPPSARDPAARRRLLSVRQRLLGAPAARRAHPDRRRARALWHLAGRHRRGRDRRRVCLAAAQGEARPRPAGGRRHDRHRDRALPVRHGARALERARGQPRRRRSLDRASPTSTCRRSSPCPNGCAARGLAIYVTVFFGAHDARQRAVGTAGRA